MKRFDLYVGLNDKNTKTQVLDTITCYKVVQNVLIKAGISGFTIFEANGFYIHDNGEIAIEKSLKIEILFTTEEIIKKIVEQLKTLLNQESVIVQQQNIKSELV